MFRYLAGALMIIAAISCAAVARQLMAAGRSTVYGPLACADDSYEENDQYSAAPALLQPVHLTELKSCPNDSDFFAFYLSAGQPIHIEISFDDAGGDLDLHLYGPGGAPFGNSASAVTEEADLSAPASGIYYVEVRPDAGITTGGIEYELTLSGGFTPTPTSTRTNTPTRTATFTPLPKATGDVNDDGDVNSIDAALVLQFGAGLLGSLGNEASADANDSGSIDSIDAALILQYGAGLIDSLPA